MHSTHKRGHACQLNLLCLPLHCRRYYQVRVILLGLTRTTFHRLKNIFVFICMNRYLVVLVEKCRDAAWIENISDKMADVHLYWYIHFKFKACYWILSNYWLQWQKTVYYLYFELMLYMGFGEVSSQASYYIIIKHHISLIDIIDDVKCQCLAVEMENNPLSLPPSHKCHDKTSRTCDIQVISHSSRFAKR